MTPIEKLVDYFGGQTKTALALGVSQAAVSYCGLALSHVCQARVQASSALPTT